MAPRMLVHVLGLCNVVAGALLAFAPALIAPVEGVHSPAATLALRSAASLLLAVAVGAWAMPPNAARRYLWIFGVVIKSVAALVWAATAFETGVPGTWVAPALDLPIAAVIAVGLITSARRGS